MKENVTGSLEWSGWIKEVAELVIHESAEDYLESILILQEQRGEVHSIDIVNSLGYSKPSVSIAMKKLRENGYISMHRMAPLRSMTCLLYTSDAADEL